MKHLDGHPAPRDLQRASNYLCPALIGISSLLSSSRALAQFSCENPISDLAQCPPCPASPKCRQPDPSKKPTFNGCGPDKFSKLIENGVIPQSYGLADFRNGGCNPSQTCGCNQHDVCYGTCNADKAACDNAFLRDLKRECDRKYPLLKKADGCPGGLCFSNQDRRSMCMRRAELYYDLVAKFGQSSYDGGQKQACQCCANAPGWSGTLSYTLTGDETTGDSTTSDTWSVSGSGMITVRPDQFGMPSIQAAMATFHSTWRDDVHSVSDDGDCKRDVTSNSLLTLDGTSNDVTTAWFSIFDNGDGTVTIEATPPQGATSGDVVSDSSDNDTGSGLNCSSGSSHNDVPQMGMMPGDSLSFQAPSTGGKVQGMTMLEIGDMPPRKYQIKYDLVLK
jgi:hypothetical protein